jgi:hypothetical protein
LSTTNPTCLDPVSNPGRRGGKPATNRLSYGAAFRLRLLFSITPMFTKKGLRKYWWVGVPRPLSMLIKACVACSCTKNNNDKICLSAVVQSVHEQLWTSWCGSNQWMCKTIQCVASCSCIGSYRVSLADNGLLTYAYDYYRLHMLKHLSCFGRISVRMSAATYDLGVGWSTASLFQCISPHYSPLLVLLLALN